MKQRLVGALVLVSLAVIFIPMLLDGGQEEPMPLFGSNIPDKPDYHFEPLEIPLEPPAPVPERQAQLIEQPEPPPAPAEPAEAPAPIAPEPQAEAPPETSETEAQQRVGWVVQVGSFSRSANAMGLRDKLRQQGFTAFVEKLRSGGSSVYRVRVGPELRREAAEAQREKIKSEMALEGLVMEHGS
ncbi:MAG: SPOR domain-containing protein [Pseudomonadota bacterium]